MSGRGATAAMLAQLAAARLRPVQLFEATFDDGAVRNSDWVRDLTWGGYTWVGNGHHVGWQDVSESSELQLSRLRVTLSGVDRTWVSTVLTKDYIGRGFRMYLGALDPDAAYTLVSDPVLVFAGTMDAPGVADDPAGQSSVTISVTNMLAQWDRRSGRHTNPREQRLHFPGDRGFNFVSAINRSIPWGNGTIHPTTSGGAGSTGLGRGEPQR